MLILAGFTEKEIFEQRLLEVSDDQVVEGKVETAKRCAVDDLGVRIKHWQRRLTLSYSARNPRDPRYCENERTNGRRSSDAPGADQGSPMVVFV